MKEPKRVLFVSQQIYPFISEQTPLRMYNHKLSVYFQAHGYETRTFMPKLGEINERRNQLHEVIRLSGMNIIIADADHPLLLKVASVQAARIQVYFVDNDDYFHRRKGYVDENGADYPDNDERCIFFARSTMETVKKLCWTPDVVVCSGWMAALVPIYVKMVYSDTPFFAHSKIILNLDSEEYTTPFPSVFSDKLMMRGIRNTDIRGIAGLPVGYEDLMRLAIDFSDVVALSSDRVNPRLINYCENKNKIIWPYAELNEEVFHERCNDLLNQNAN